MAIKPPWTPLYGSQARPPSQGKTQPHQIASPLDGLAMFGAYGLIPSGVRNRHDEAKDERPKTAPYPTLLI